MTLLDLALVLFINVLWGLTFIAGKVGLMEMPPVLFTGLRFTLLIVVLSPMLRIVPKQMPRILEKAIATVRCRLALRCRRSRPRRVPATARRLVKRGWSLSEIPTLSRTTPRTFPAIPRCSSPSFIGWRRKRR